jgi:predicted transcriptional regulator
MEYRYFGCDESILEALFNGEKWFNELARVLKMNKVTLSRKLRLMERNGFVSRRKMGRKIVYHLTPLGIDACSYFKIKRETGFVGLEWAEGKLASGYKVRLLSDLTGLAQHKRWLFAWNPETGNCDLAAIFGVRSLKSKEGGPRYLAQLVDREKSPDKPLKSAEIFEYFESKVEDWNDEQAIAKTLKSFWSLENFNAYLCAFVPEEVTMGFPNEIGHFSGLMLVGFGYQECFPFIPQMSIMAGGFNFSKNLKVLLEYNVDLNTLYNYCWLLAKSATIPGSIHEEDLMKCYTSAFKVHTLLACKNEQNGKCKKMDITCVAISDQGIVFSKCPILAEEAKQV